MPGITDDYVVSFGGQIKAFDKRGRFREVGGLGIEFTDENRKDLHGEYFDAETDYGPSKGDGAYCLFHHGIPIRSEPSFISIAQKIFKPVSLTEDEKGLFYSTVLDMSDDYENMIYDLQSRGKLFWSSGALPQTAKTADNGRIEVWHPVELSFTPTPANPDLPRIMDVKSFKAMPMPDVFLDIEERATAHSGGDVATQADLITLKNFRERIRVHG